MSRTALVLLCWLPLLALPRVGAAAERLVCYVSVGGENRLAAYHLDPATGKLEPARGIELDGAPGSLAVSPSGRLLYAALRSNGRIAALRIDPATGALALARTVPAVDNPVYLTTDATGRHLLTAYYGAGKVAVFPLGTDGLPADKPSQVLDTGKNPHSILADPSNRYVFAPSTGADLIQQYRLDTATGRLTPGPQPRLATTKGAGPRHLRFHPKLPVLYAVNETDSTVTAYRLDPATGSLTALQTLSTLPQGFTGKNSCADIEVTPDGKYVYCSNRGHDSLAGYAVDAATGKLTALGQTPTEKTPREFALDPAGRFVIAAGQDSGRLAVYRLDGATGKLDRLATYDVGKGPAWVTVIRLGPSGEK